MAAGCSDPLPVIPQDSKDPKSGAERRRAAGRRGCNGRIWVVQARRSHQSERGGKAEGTAGLLADGFGGLAVMEAKSLGLKTDLPIGGG